MKVLNKKKIIAFKKKHNQARKALDKWLAVVQKAHWQRFDDIRLIFKTADRAKGKVIFDIKGNNYRVITIVTYVNNTVIIEKVMTHREYDKWCKSHQ